MDQTNTASPKPYNPLEVMSPGEQNLMELKRHPFGLIGLYISAVLAILVIFVIAVLIPHFVSGLTSQDKTGIMAGAIVLVAIVLLYIYIAVTIYNGNRWIVTTDSITQINQVGLFKKVTSQLSLANLEDVTFEQDNFIQTMLGFGTLKVESAGERAKFSFTFCPKPDDCARKIIAAHEQFINARPENMQEANRGTVETQAFSQQSYPQPLPQSDPASAPQSSGPSATNSTQDSNSVDDEYDIPN